MIPPLGSTTSNEAPDKVTTALRAKVERTTALPWLHPDQ